MSNETLNKIVILVDPDDAFVRLFLLIDVMYLDWIFVHLSWLMNIMHEYLYACFN
jgi:hypothetical protein